jgi:hypothetical protein
VSNAPVPVFYSYAHEDETFRIELAKQLKILERTGIISGWSDRDIAAGEDWRNTISENLKDAKIILLLVSPDFLASDYCYDVEMSYALGRHNRGEAIVIPVFLRKTLFELAPFAKLQGLPKDAKAITDWLNRDDAFAEIAAGIQQAAERIRNKNTGATKDVGPEWNKSDLVDVRPTPLKGMSHRMASALPRGSQFDLLKHEFQNLTEIDRELMNNKEDTRAASVNLVEWKKRVAAIVGSDEIYTIEPDHDRWGKGMYGVLRNTMKKYRRYMESLISHPD